MPNFPHDCDSCVHLGPYNRGEQVYELYYCGRCDDGSVLARYGTEGWEYQSMPLEILLYAGHGHDSPLVEAARRQIQRWRNLEREAAVPSWSPARLWRKR